MIYQVIKAPQGETDYFFATTTFTHDGTFYKAAIVEELAPDAEATGGYAVFLQSEKGTQNATIHKVDGIWVCDTGVWGVVDDVAEKLGVAIDALRK